MEKSVRDARLRDAAHLYAGLALSGRSPAGRGSERVPIVSVGDIQDGRVRREGLAEIRVELLAKVERYLVQAGDVLVACRGTQPKVCVAPPDLTGVALTSSLIGIRLKDGLLPEVLAAYLRSRQGQQALLSQVRSATGQIALSVADLADLQVPAPSPDVQRHIAKLVRLADAHHTAATEAAALRRDIAYAYAIQATKGERRQAQPAGRR